MATSTCLRLPWEETVTHRTFHSVHGLKSIGYVQVYPYVPPPQKKRIPAEADTKRKQALKKQSSASNACLAIGFAGLALVAAFAFPYFYNRP